MIKLLDLLEKKMTPAQKKKRGEIFDTLVAGGMAKDKAGAIATSKAMKLEKKGKDQDGDGDVDSDDWKISRDKAIKANLKELTAPENARITIAQLMGPDFFLAQKDETKWTDLEIDLFNRIFKMASETGYIPVMKTEGQDHEVAMAVSSLEEIAKAIIELRQQLGNTERNIPGWIQDHIAKAENYIEQAAQGFHELKNDE